MFQAGRKRVDLEPGCRRRLLPFVPAPRRRHLERRNRALRLRLRHHRRAAPGRRRCCALQLAPKQRRSADQRDDARKNCRKTHAIPLLIAGTLEQNRARDGSAIPTCLLPEVWGCRIATMRSMAAYRPKIAARLFGLKKRKGPDGRPLSTQVLRTIPLYIRRHIAWVNDVPRGALPQFRFLIAVRNSQRRRSDLIALNLKLAPVVSIHHTFLNALAFRSAI